MILMVLLFALTVPSAPSPKKRARWTSSASMRKLESCASEVPLTSSTMPTVKWLRGSSVESSSKTLLIIAGVSSFDDKP